MCLYGMNGYLYLYVVKCNANLYVIMWLNINSITRGALGSVIHCTMKSSVKCILLWKQRYTHKE